MNKFELKDGQLSQYAFLCGYIPEFKNNNVEIFLFQDGDYQIETWSKHNPYLRLFRKSFDYSLTEARKEFKNQVKIWS